MENGINYKFNLMQNKNWNPCIAFWYAFSMSFLMTPHIMGGKGAVQGSPKGSSCLQASQL